MRTLVQISAFWRNDKPDGVGLTLTEEFGDLESILDTIKTAYDLMWNEAQRDGSLSQLIQDLRVQLACIGSIKGNLDYSHASIVIGNVWLLEKHGHMISDEFNGLMLGYFDG